MRIVPRKATKLTPMFSCAGGERGEYIVVDADPQNVREGRLGREIFHNTVLKPQWAVHEHE